MSLSFSFSGGPRRFARASLIAALPLVICLAMADAALGATINVTTTADEVVADGQCSLREAITAANDDSTGPGGDCAKGSGADRVSVPSGHFILSLENANENANAKGDLDVLSNLTIAGAGARATTIDANRIDRVLEVRPGRVATIRGVTITGGRAPDGSNGFNRTGTAGAPDGGEARAEDGNPGAPGGGIFNNGGSLTVVASAVTDNVAGTGGRGGIAHGGDGALGNNGGNGGDAFGGDGGVGGDGGGIDTTGVLVLTRVSVTRNTAGTGGAGGPGTGGQGGAATATNGVGGDGGLGLGGRGGAGGDGGGVAESGGGSLVIKQSVIGQNTAGGGGQGGFGQGGAGGLSSGSSGVGGAGGRAQGGIGGFFNGRVGGAGGGVSAADSAVLRGDLIVGNAAGAAGHGGNGTGGLGGVTTGGAGSVSGDGGNAFSGQAGFASFGGGVWRTGSVVNSTVTANVAGRGGDAGNATGGKGGGSINGTGGDGGNGLAKQTGGGADGGFGGGLSTDGDLTIRHATVTANSPGAGGAAGIATAGSGGAAPTPGSAGTTTPGSPGSPGSGGGWGAIFGTTTLTNSIMAGNTAPSCDGPLLNGGHDISFPDASCPGANVDPKLGPLAGNGGRTRTQALSAGSPAIDAVPASGAGCAAIDQRGVRRPNGSACDIGAYEHAPPTVATARATRISTGAATLHGLLNPNARSTTYRFAFGTTIAYGRATPSRTQAAGVEAVAVKAAVRNLKPATTYHYRLVATNADGTTRGRDRTFTTAAVKRK